MDSAQLIQDLLLSTPNGSRDRHEHEVKGSELDGNQ